jgi:hypothetical protein
MVLRNSFRSSVVVWCGTLFLLCLPGVGRAYVPLVVERESVSALHTIEDPTLEQYFYGTLNNFPHTFVITQDEAFTLQVEVLVPEMEGSKNEVNGIIVKKEGRQGRVVEVARMLAKEASWESFREPWGGDKYRRGAMYSALVEPGTYHIEVSTPNNDSPYALVVGTRKERGEVSYFEMIGRIKDVKSFYGRSSLMVIESPYVFGPIVGILLVCGGVWYWYRRRYL